MKNPSYFSYQINIFDSSNCDEETFQGVVSADSYPSALETVLSSYNSPTTTINSIRLEELYSTDGCLELTAQALADLLDNGIIY